MKSLAMKSPMSLAMKTPLQFAHDIKDDNHLWIIINSCINANWEWSYILWNPKTTIKLMEYFKDKNAILRNPNIKWDMLLENDGKLSMGSWYFDNIKLLYRNPNIDWQIISANRHIFTNDQMISTNSSITMEIIDANPDINWDYNELSAFAQIDINYVLTKNKPWNYKILSNNKYLIRDYIMQNLRIVFYENEYLLSEIDFVGGYDYDAFIEKIINNKKIMSCVLESIEPNLTWMEFISDYIKPNWYYVSKNKLITMEMVMAFPKNPWNWAGLSQNANMTMEIIEKYPQFPWEWKWISRNPNLTWQYHRDHLNDHEWSYFNMSMNKFQYGQN
jgi:hypothetical protein